MTKNRKEQELVTQSSHPCPNVPSTELTVLSRLAQHIPSALPLDIPQVDSQLEHRFWLERSAETLRYTFQFIEYAISPKGGLRQWIKLNLLLLAFLGIPILFILPLLAFAFGQISDISLYFQQCMTHLLQASIPTLILVFLLSLIVMMVKK